LSSLGELLFLITNSHKDLDGTATAVRVDVQESLLQYVEKGVDLSLIILTSLFLTAQVGN
jgi:hypothetical protein